MGRAPCSDSRVVEVEVMVLKSTLSIIVMAYAVEIALSIIVMSIIVMAYVVEVDSE